MEDSVKLCEQRKMTQRKQEKERENNLEECFLYSSECDSLMVYTRSTVGSPFDLSQVLQ